jgi:hypothetical protein
MSDFSPEVDFAARYWGGDWTEEGEAPALQQAWAFETDTGLAFVIGDPVHDLAHVLSFAEDGTPINNEVWRNKDGTFTIIGRNSDGSPSEPVRCRLDIHDTGYVIVDVP